MSLRGGVFSAGTTFSLWPVVVAAGLDGRALDLACWAGADADIGGGADNAGAIGKAGTDTGLLVVGLGSWKSKRAATGLCWMCC